MIKCKICNKEFKTPKQLSWHVKHHNMNNQQYYDLFLKKENEGICLTCGKPTSFISLNLGYRQHCDKACTKADKQIQEKRMNTNLEKYGYKTFFSTEETQNKIKQSIFNKYNVTNAFAAEEIKNKIKQDNIKKYGVENAQQRAEIKEKTANTNLEKYGNTCVLQNSQIKQKIKQTNLIKYGAENIFGSEYGKQKIKQTCLAKYGVEYAQQDHNVHVKTMKHYKYDSLNFDSSWELAVYIYCKDYNIYIEREPCRFSYINALGKKSYYFPDFKIKNYLVEIKGDQFLDENGELKDKEKLNCIKKHNVKIWLRQDVQKYIKYCEEKFENIYWYHQFK